MCGRFTLHRSWREIVELYRLTAPADLGRNTVARYNISPTQDVLFVTAGEGGGDTLREGRWWLVPAWAKEMPRYAMFNARSEDADSKPAFRDSFRRQRCLIPADGFYEWTRGEDGGRDPWYIHLPEGRPFSFAGLWAYNPLLEITSCTILTMAAAEPVSALHTRQPVILAEDAYDAWLDPATPVAEARQLIERNLCGALQFYRVGRTVNSSRAEGPALILPEPAAARF